MLSNQGHVDVGERPGLATIEASINHSRDPPKQYPPRYCPGSSHPPWQVLPTPQPPDFAYGHLCGIYNNKAAYWDNKGVTWALTDGTELESAANGLFVVTH
jgi:hypothetical protein